jgi:uncharacterized protein YqeY
VTGPDDLLARIQADANAALKAGDKDRVRVLRMLASDLKRAAIDGGKDAVVGDEALAVLRRAVKTRADSVDQYDKAGRKELADRERQEISTIDAYLPKAASEEEVRAVARGVIASLGVTGMKAMGQVMKETLARLGAGADGKTVSRVVGELLKG